jgi:uncharacterized membrane protein HdeD (DUF308 family)
MDSQAVNGTALGIRGVLATLFGIAAVFWPGITLVTLVYLFSAFVLINGLVNLVFGVGNLVGSEKSLMSRFLTLLLSLLEIGVGVYLLRHTGVTFATFILLIAMVLIVRGVFEIVEALFDGGAGFNRMIMGLLGILAIIAGIVVLFQPAASGVAFVWIIGIYALITGPLLIAMGMEVNKAARPIAPARRA